MDKFVILKELAKNTVGVYDKCYGDQLETLLDLHSQIDCKIDEIEREIKQIIEDLNPPTPSVKGIGPVSAAVIISEFGDILRFPNPNKMCSFAGLEPGYFQSGTFEHKGHMVKRGSPHLRSTLLNCCRSLRLHNETFAVYYRKKIAEGKPETVFSSIPSALQSYLPLRSRGIRISTFPSRVSRATYQFVRKKICEIKNMRYITRYTACFVQSKNKDY